MTTSSRRVKSLIARPRISSLQPREYRFAVSKKLMPPSRARWMNGRLCSSSMLPCVIAAIGDAVAHAAEAGPRYLKPVRPNFTHTPSFDLLDGSFYYQETHVADT